MKNFPVGNVVCLTLTAVEQFINGLWASWGMMGKVSNYLTIKLKSKKNLRVKLVLNVV